MRCILYLEPGESNPLLPHLRAFMKKSQSIGVNEAQQYRPHCSVTGFFEIPPTLVTRDLIRTVCDVLEVYLREHGELFSVQVGDIVCAPSECRSKECHAPSTSVRIELTTNGFREMASELRNHMKTFGVNIRVKPVDHISLSYVTNFPQVEGVSQYGGSNLYYECSSLEDNEPEKSCGILKYDHRLYLTAARDHFAGVLEQASNDWKLILHSEVHSTRMSKPHQFTPLREWDLAGLLHKKYPDR